MITTAQHNLAMEQAWGVIREMSADEQERAEAEAVEKARRDMVARLRSAEMKGLAEGRAEGKVEGLAEGQLGIVTFMLNQGRTADEISSLIGLSLDAVSSLVTKAKPLQ